jgi:hypothetical protein
MLSQLLEILQAISVHQSVALEDNELADWLYDNWVSGWQEPAGTINYAEIRNQRVAGLDLTFGSALHQQNCGDGYWESGWTVVSQASPKHLNVCKQNLTLQATIATHLKSQQSHEIGDVVDLRLPKNLVMGDRYVAVANEGKPMDPLTQIFFHLDQTDIPSVIQRITQDLNQRQIAFTLAVPYDPLDYPCRDAAILNLASSDMTDVSALLYEWAKDWQPMLRSTVPLFTTELFPGMSYFKANDSDDSLGKRCAILADAIRVALPYDREAQVPMILDILQAEGINDNRE